MPNHWTDWLFDLRVRGLKVPGVEPWLMRPFGHSSDVRLLILRSNGAIARSQVAPFLTFGPELLMKYGASIRVAPFDKLQDLPDELLASATHVLLQPWFTISSDELAKSFETIERKAGKAYLSVLDCFAPNDLRLARHLPEGLSFYVKKSLFRNRSHYGRSWRGDTNLVDYYGTLYGIDSQHVDFRPPSGFVNKLRLGPGFFTTPNLSLRFRRKAPPPQVGRVVDMQTRLGAKGSSWYQAMRTRALEAANNIEGITVSTPGRVSRRQYLAELAQSRLCFSPFGYGELCWRDFEAFATGSVLVKPDMGHLETLPDLYEPYVTYLPVRWDFADLGDVVNRALTDMALRERIATAAFRRVRNYIFEAKFVDDMAFLFDAPEGPGLAS